MADTSTAPPRRSRRTLFAGAMVAVSSVCFATMPTFAKLSYNHGAEPLSLLLIRFLIAGGLLLAVSHLFVRPLRLGKQHRGLVPLTLLFATQAICFFGALSLGSATITIVLLYTYPLIVTLASAAIYGERITAPIVAVLVLGLAGITLTVGELGDGFHLGGALLGLTAGILFAGVMLVSKRVLEAVPPLEMTGMMYSGAALLYLVAVPFRGLATPSDGDGWLAVAGVVAVGTLFGMGLLMIGLERLPAGITSMLTIIEPAVAIATAAAILGETVTALQIAGIALVLTALVTLGALLVRRPPPLPAPPPPG